MCVVVISIYFSDLKLVSEICPSVSPQCVQLVTRAVRVIDLVTGLDMSAFHSLGGWDKMLLRLEMEVGKCREETPLVLSSELKPARKQEQGDTQQTSIIPCDVGYVYMCMYKVNGCLLATASLQTY